MNFSSVSAMITASIAIISSKLLLSLPTSDVVRCRWNVRLPVTKTPLERTWLYHEMGRCHFELGNYERARELGERSYQEATSARDKVWLLNSTILVAQALGQSVVLVSTAMDGVTPIHSRRYIFLLVVVRSIFTKNTSQAFSGSSDLKHSHSGADLITLVCCGRGVQQVAHIDLSCGLLHGMLRD